MILSFEISSKRLSMIHFPWISNLSSHLLKENGQGECNLAVTYGGRQFLLHQSGCIWQLEVGNQQARADHSPYNSNFGVEIQD
jgi:hypothetical protein